MKTSDFYYDLPEGLIAQTPVEPRDSARFLVMNKETGELTHTIFNKIGDFLQEGDLLVVNNTKVIPARLYGYRADKESVTKYEALLLRRVNFTDWECIMRPARKATVGARLKFSDELIVVSMRDQVSLDLTNSQSEISAVVEKDAQEAVFALVSLGISNSDAVKIVAEVSKTEKGAENIIREALKRL